MSDEEGTREDVTRLTEWIEERIVANGRVDATPAEIQDIWIEDHLQLPIPPREELLGPLVIRGERLVIGAETGAGKTTLVWWIIGALATGRPFLGWRSTRPMRVLVVDVEQMPWDLNRLATETGIGQTSRQVAVVSVPDGLSLDTQALERERLGVILAKGWDAVVLDPLYKLHTGDQNDDKQAKALMKLIDGWRVQHNFALILPAHMRKPPAKAREQDFTLNEIAGASTYLRGAEAVLGLRLLSDGFSRLYFFKSRSPGLPVRTSWPLRFDRNQGYVIAETSADRAKREHDATLQLVRSKLMEFSGTGVDVATLVEDTGKSRPSVQRMLEELGAEWRIAPGRAKKKLYFMPEVEPDQQDMEFLADEDDE